MFWSTKSYISVKAVCFSHPPTVGCGWMTVNGWFNESLVYTALMVCIWRCLCETIAYHPPYELRVTLQHLATATSHSAVVQCLVKSGLTTTPRRLCGVWCVAMRCFKPSGKRTFANTVTIHAVGRFPGDGRVVFYDHRGQRSMS